MDEFFRKNRESLNGLIVLLLTVVTIYIFVKHIFAYIAPFITAFLLAAALEPFIQFMTGKLKFKRWLASLFSVLFVLTILGLIVSNIVFQAISQAQSLIENLPYYINEINALLENLDNRMADVINILPVEIRLPLSNANTDIAEFITAAARGIVQKNSINAVTTIPNILMFILLTILSTFFICKDKYLLEGFIKAHIPQSWINFSSMIKKNLLGVIAGYIKAQLILMTFTGMICVCALYIMKSKYALLMSLVIALIDAFPIFGAGFILWPWAAYSALLRNYSLCMGLLITYLLVFLSRQALEPKVLSKEIGMHPLMVLMSIYAGLKIFGMGGFIIGPMSVVIIMTVMDNFFKNR